MPNGQGYGSGHGYSEPEPWQSHPDPPDLSWIGTAPIIEEVTFGQGAFGHRCRLCCEDDYQKTRILHRPGCPGRGRG